MPQHFHTAFELYPASFFDSNGDGIGDLQGAAQKLPYLRRLGVDLLWICPFCLSPGVDNGYDIADYQMVDPRFGTLDDFDALVARAKDLGIAVLMDLVVNHCSSEHEWFKRACADPCCEEAGFFYLRPGKNGQMPNNLRSNFGGSIWDPLPGHDDLYYCHFYAKEQPCLNWFNPELRARIYAMMRWWLARGVAGFRIDTIMSIGKDPSFPDYPPDLVGDGRCACGAMNDACQDTALTFLREMKAQVLSPCDAFTVGEVWGPLPPEKLKQLIGPDGVFTAIFDFSARSELSCRPGFYAYTPMPLKRWRDLTFAAAQRTPEGGLLALAVENHDSPRAVSCWLPESMRNSSGAKALAAVLMTLPGLPFIYQGQELGMTNVHFNSIAEMPDIQSVEEYRRALEHGLTPDQALSVLNRWARDHGRVPFPWSSAPQGGFTTGQPWMRLHQDYAAVNAAVQDDDPHSVLTAYRRLGQLRRRPELQTLLQYSALEPKDHQQDLEIAFFRVHGQQRLFTAANFGNAALTYQLQADAEMLFTCGTVLRRHDACALMPGSALIALLPEN